MTLTIYDKRPRKGMFQAIKDETRNAAIEECALLVAERAIWTSDPDLKDGLIAVAAAIRALKDREQDIKKAAVSNQWRCKLCGALTYGSQCDNCKHTPSDYPTR